jgi:hypothetical protein
MAWHAVVPKSGKTKTKTKTYEDDAKRLFIEQPANMRLLMVVDKLLTGFDAPSCTYLYIDKSMQDQGARVWRVSARVAQRANRAGRSVGVNEA